MRALIVSVAVLFLTCSFVYADTTSKASDLTDDINSFKDAIHEHEVHTHEYDKADRRNEVGVGADVTLWKNKDESKLITEVSEQYRYDWQNGDHSAFTVVHVNLWDKIKGFFGKDEQ